MCHAAPVVFPVDFDSGVHVYQVHPINVQLVRDPGIMLAKEEHGCDSGSESSNIRCCRKGRMIGSRISFRYITAFNVP